jgi:site-specific recombinase XerD
MGMKKRDGIAVVVEEFLLDCESRGLSGYTVLAYRAALKSFQTWAGTAGLGSLSEVTSSHLRTYTAHCLAEVSPGAAHARLRPLRTLFGWSVTEELLKVNPMVRVKLPKIPDVVLGVVRPAVFRKLVAASKMGRKPLRDVAMLTVLFDTGLRASELCNLRESDVLDGGALLVRQGKGGKSRTVPISRDTVRAIRAYLHNERPETLVPELFLIDEAGGMTYQTLEGLLTRLCKTTGVDHVSPHAFRRGFVVEMVRQGADTFTVQRIMGHSTPAQTQRYCKLDNNDIRDIHRRSSPVAALKRK